MKRLLPLMCLALAASGCQRGGPAPTGAADITSRRDLGPGPPGIPNQGIHVARLPATTTIGSVRFSPDGQHVYISYGYGREGYAEPPSDFRPVRAFNVRTGAEEWASRDRDASPIDFSADGRLMFSYDSSSRDGKAAVRRADTGDILRTFFDREVPVANLRVTPDGKRLVTTDHFDRLLLWDVGSGKLLRIFDGDAPYMFHDGTRLLTPARAPHQAKVWDVATGRAVQSFGLPASYRGALALTPDDKYLVIETSEEDESRGPRKTKYRLVTLDLEDGKVVRTFAERQGGGPPNPCSGRALAWAFTPGGKLLVTADNDAVLRTWDLRTGEVVRSREVLFNVAALSPDGKLAVSKVGTLYDVETGKEVRNFTYPLPPIDPLRPR